MDKNRGYAFLNILDKTILVSNVPHFAARICLVRFHAEFLPRDTHDKEAESYWAYLLTVQPRHPASTASADALKIFCDRVHVWVSKWNHKLRICNRIERESVLQVSRKDFSDGRIEE